MPLSAVDWIIVVILTLAGLNGLRKGFFITAFGLVGLVASLLVASWYYQPLADRLHSLLPWLKLAEVFSFLLLLVLVSVAAGLLGRSLRNFFRWAGLGWADRLAGLGLGLLQGALLITIMVIFLSAFWPQCTWLKASQLAQGFLVTAQASEFLTPDSLSNRVKEGVHDLEQTRKEFLHLKT
jgi:membrane protein required for colicin V production